MIHRHQKADGNDGTTTPFTIPKRRQGTKKNDIATVDKERDEMDRMDKLFKKYEMNEIPKVEWLDHLVWRVSERRASEVTRSSVKSLQRQASLRQDAGKSSAQDGSLDAEHDAERVPSQFTLTIELPRFDFPVVFTDHEYLPAPISTIQQLSASQSNIEIKPPPEVQFGPGINGSAGGSSQIVRIYDPEVAAKDNPAESKHRRLVRSQHRHGILDKDLRPNAKVRDELNTIMAYSPTHTLTLEEKDLVWKFRYHLTKDKRAVTKFVKSVNWQDQSESKQAIQVLAKWTEIDVDDALELLGPTFDSPAVRAYAVDRLSKADDNELMLYLLQLVQALKFEHIPTDSRHPATEASSLATFLISRAVENFTLGNYFYWYLGVEWDDKSPEQSPEVRTMYAKVQYDFMRELESRPGGLETRQTMKRQAELIAVFSKISSEIQASHESSNRKLDKVKALLADPKTEMLTIEPPLPLPLDPSVMITGVVPEETRVFKSSLSPIMATFKTVSGGKYPMMFKTGDDLRQDQLILATSTTAGASQFVPSQTFAHIAKKHRNNPVLRTSSSITLTSALKWASPFAPAVKLSKEMVDAMGGSNSDLYLQFKQYCSLAFAALRKSSNLILNLFSLMVHANIPDIKLEPDKAVLKVQERFHLDLPEEEATRLFWSIMEDSLSAYMPTARQLLDLGLSKLMAVRSVPEAETARESLLEGRSPGSSDIEIWYLDLSSYQAIAKFAERAKTLQRLDIAILDAAL
ncbi:Phosphatidylinositol 3-kinase- root isoform [Apiospora phragmitis]|uniref:Phosphatidylinositol 3-kinase VPS34 n=1 Tax=Apiospora phragmitis TaxID=2905665 RepID=A0ABR1VRD3_9PEZI